MTIIDASICTAIFIIGLLAVTVPCVIMYFARRAIINWTKWFIKVHRKFDDDWYDL